MLDLAGEDEIFVCQCIETITADKYYQSLDKLLETTTETIPSQCRIGETCFMSVAVVG